MEDMTFQESSVLSASSELSETNTAPSPTILWSAARRRDEDAEAPRVCEEL